MTTNAETRLPTSRPPQATHCVPESPARHAGWLFHDGLNWHYCRDRQPFDWINFGDDDFPDAVLLPDISVAPQNDESRNVARHEWYEGDIPPVGLAFEFTSNGGHNWNARTILYKDDSVILLDGHQLFKLADPDIGFRPARTPEQISADEWKKTFATMLKDSICDDGQAIWEGPAKKLYDAGWRKP